MAINTFYTLISLLEKISFLTSVTSGLFCCWVEDASKAGIVAFTLRSDLLQPFRAFVEADLVWGKIQWEIVLAGVAS